MYTGELDLTEQPVEDILELLIASDELLLEELFKHVQDYLIEKQTGWIQHNFVLVLYDVFKFDSCKRLQDYCLDLICADPQPFITWNNFPLLDRDILYGLLKRDDLLVERIVIWDCLIRWGIEQTPGLGSMNGDITRWNQENFKDLEKTLSPFIPLIRFEEISRADFFNKVRPYKAVIPHHVYEEIEKFHYIGTLPKTTLPPRSGNIDSRLIKPKLFNIITSWIERKDENDPPSKTRYNFELLYRSSRDGLNTNEFRKKCNNHGPCLVLVKQHYSTKICGGYNPLKFVYNSIGKWYSTSESFIFSFENNNDTTNMKISRINSSYTNYAIYECYNQGFSFGQAFYMSDQNICLQYQGYYDENITNSYYFVPEEIEVFKVNVL